MLNARVDGGGKMLLVARGFVEAAADLAAQSRIKHDRARVSRRRSGPYARSLTALGRLHCSLRLSERSAGPSSRYSSAGSGPVSYMVATSTLRGPSFGSGIGTAA